MAPMHVIGHSKPGYHLKQRAAQQNETKLSDLDRFIHISYLFRILFADFIAVAVDKQSRNDLQLR